MPTSKRAYLLPDLRRIDAEAFNAAVYGYLAALPPCLAQELPALTRQEREQRRGARPRPELPGLLQQAAADGKTVCGAIRPDGSQVYLLSVFDVTAGTARAQREVGAKTNEIPELTPAIAHLDLIGQVVTLDAPRTQAATARHLVEDKHAHYLMIVKASQPSLLQAVTNALAGPDADFAAPHGPNKAKDTAAASGAASAPPPPRASTGRTPPRSCASAATPAPRKAPESRMRAPTALPACPRTWPEPATWPFAPAVTGPLKTVRTTSETRHSPKISSGVRTGNQPDACAAIRNLVKGAFHRAGFANIAHARRYYGCDDQRILALYGYT